MALRLPGVLRPMLGFATGAAARKVRAVGPDGRPATACHPMTPQPGASRRIDGHGPEASEEHQA